MSNHEPRAQVQAADVSHSQQISAVLPKGFMCSFTNQKSFVASRSQTELRARNLLSCHRGIAKHQSWQLQTQFHSLLWRDCQTPQLAGEGMQSLSAARLWQPEESCTSTLMAGMHLCQSVVNGRNHTHASHWATAMNCCNIALHDGNDVAPASCWGNIAAPGLQLRCSIISNIYVASYVDAHCHQSTRCVEPQSTELCCHT